MTISLEELKQQREQIRKHLEWLDAKISELAPSETEAHKAEGPTEAMPPLPAGAQLYTPPAPEESQGATAPETAEADQPLPKVAVAPNIESSYKPKTQREVLRAKIGCLALFILSTALFLFLLFGLPYLL